MTMGDPGFIPPWCHGLPCDIFDEPFLEDISLFVYLSSNFVGGTFINPPHHFIENFYALF
jgi:hypothetical protein